MFEIKTWRKCIGDFGQGREKTMDEITRMTQTGKHGRSGLKKWNPHQSGILYKERSLVATELKSLD